MSVCDFDHKPRKSGEAILQQNYNYKYYYYYLQFLCLTYFDAF